MTTDDDGLTEQLWVYIGHREGADGLLDVYVPLVDGRAHPTATYPYAAARSVNTVGAVYSVMATQDGARARVKSAKFVRLYDDAALRAAWRVEHDACDLQRELDARERKGKELNLSALDEIRRTYMRAGSRERTLIEVLVLKYLRMQK